jgi:hypothetical protein
MDRTTDLKEIRQRNPFSWGTIVEIYDIGKHYTVVEYHPWKREGSNVLTGKPNFDKLEYHCYVDGKDTCSSMETFDGALINCITYKNDRPHSPAVTYIMRMLGMEE